MCDHRPQKIHFCIETEATRFNVIMFVLPINYKNLSHAIFIDTKVNNLLMCWGTLVQREPV